MGNIDSVIALVLSRYVKFKKYIDEDEIYREAILSIKEFGGQSTEYFETVIDVENGIGELPSNFYRLEGALKCNETSGDCGKTEIRTLLSSSVVVDYNDVAVNLKNCCYTEDKVGYTLRHKRVYDSKIITGKKYSNFEPLEINRNVNKNSCSSKCFNFYFSGLKNSLSIDYARLRIKTSFNEGTVFIRYKGFPINESGDIDFNDTANSSFERYIEYALRAKISEMLVGVEGAESVVQMLNYNVSQKRYYKSLTKDELNWSNFDTNRFVKNIQNRNKLDYLRDSGSLM